MRTIEITLYTFNELSEKAQEKAIYEYESLNLIPYSEVEAYSKACDITMEEAWDELTSYENARESCTINEWEYLKDGTYYYDGML
jgi:hypothetical protein